MWMLYLFLLLCFESMLGYLAHDYEECCSWISILDDKIKNDFLLFMAKFWSTAILGFGAAFSFIKLLLTFITPD